MNIIYFLVLSLIMRVEIPWYHKTHLQIEKIVESLEEYKGDCGFYPNTEEGLNELISSDKDCWKGPYAAPVMFKDKFKGKPYMYSIENGKYEIVSAGNDGKFGTNDDFKSSDDSKEKSRVYSLYGKHSEISVIKIVFISLTILTLVYVRLIKDRH